MRAPPFNQGPTIYLMPRSGNFIVLVLSAVLLGFPASSTAQSGARVQPLDALRQGFLNPPDSAKLRCYWWWLNGNTNEQTITHELTEMRSKGFGGVLLVDANGSNQNGNENVPPGPEFGSPAWVELYLHALKVAASLHMEVTLNITSGWNLGGPDVTPAQATKLLTWSRTEVKTGGFDGVLPMPPVKNGFYRQIAVLAYPLHHGTALPGRDGDARSPIRALAEKSAAVETGISMPDSESLLEDAPATPGEEDTLLTEIIDLSGQTQADGRLRWTAPDRGDGRAWEILRIGYTDSDARVSTSSGAWQGLAIDYMDRGAFDAYWSEAVAPLLRAARPYLGSTLVNLATDSWEVGGTNWTGRFRDEFRHRRGYDPLPYLPIVAGRIVQDRVTSDRFLNDLRRTVGDLLTDHFDHFAERAREYGLGVQAESGGPHGAPIDALETFRSSAMPQTEYWAPSREHRIADEDRFFTKEAASAADIYGKPYAAEEGMSSIGPQWSESLAVDLKPAFDRAVTEGMTRLVWHEFTSSPAAWGLPGYEYFAGTHINDKITWWQQGGAFFAYLNRTQFLAQQGYSVDDALYFYGDEVPNFVRLKRDDPAHVLPGYDYDVTDEDALLHSLPVRDGAIFSPSGNRYRILVMPASRHLSLAALERIAEYVRQGGTAVGLVPLSPTGIVSAGVSRQFAALARQMWGACSDRPRSYGAGKVFCTSDARSVLAQLQVKPDFYESTGRLDYIHRRRGDADIYFVRNRGGRPVETLAQFRVTGRIPEFWNAVNGVIAPQAFYRAGNGVTRVPIHLGPYGSMFVVFRKPSGPQIAEAFRDGQPAELLNVGIADDGSWSLPDATAGTYRLRFTDGAESTVVVPETKIVDLPASQWTIAFQPGRGAPAQPQPLSAFTSWTESPDAGIRYFSGTARYSTSVNLGDVQGTVLLRLADLHEICTARINGKDAGTIWSMPYELDITGEIRPGENLIQLDVTNLWPNRIIGDTQPGNVHRYTHTNIRKYTRDSPLLPSGIVGPVTLEIRPALRLRPALSEGRSASEVRLSHRP
jgi:hypothetical protein